MAPIDVRGVAPLTHDEALRLQETELERTLRLLRSLDADAWLARTDCPEWDVRELYLHVLGACESGASTRENVHQLRGALKERKKAGAALEAALSAVQVRERQHLRPDDLVTRLAAVAPKTIRGRRRLPAFVRSVVKIPVDSPVVEKWTLGYLTGTIYLRDLWMHRVDAVRATRGELELTADHDGRIIADVVAEWARRHGDPFTLELTGPAGGTYAVDPDSSRAEKLTFDAVEFCRTLAGRSSASGLLTTVVPF